MAIFLDTGFFMGLVDPTDIYYTRSLELLYLLKSGTLGQPYTSTYVMSETGTLVAIRTNNNQMVLKHLEDIFLGNQTIALLFRSNELEEREIWNLFQKINSSSKRKTVSFVDCSNIVFCRNHSIPQILSYDSHFDSWLTRIS